MPHNIGVQGAEVFLIASTKHCPLDHNVCDESVQIILGGRVDKKIIDVVDYLQRGCVHYWLFDIFYIS